MSNARHRRRRALLLSLAAVLLGAVALVASHSWGPPYHWARTANPFTLKLGDNVSSVWDPFLATTSADWSDSSVLDTTIVAGGTRPRPCRPTSGRVEVCSARYGNNGWLGLAQIWITGGEHIVQGVVKVNDYYYSAGYADGFYDTPAWRNLVMCQEVGHTFGLDHQDENFDNAPLGTCMDYSSDPNPNQHPNAHDYDQLEEIYAHLDGFTSVGQIVPRGRGHAALPPAMTAIDFEGPGQWGRQIRRSPDGRLAVYELDFGGGNKVLTRVIFVK
jgi:hypothetical protein